MNLRQMELVINVDHLKVDIQATLKKYKTIKQWAYILHDKDDTNPHYHIYMNFSPSSCDTAMVAKWFDLAYTTSTGEERSGEQFINKVRGRKTDMLLYLTHGNESQKNKHQYSSSEIIANFDFEREIENSKILGDFERFSYAQQLDYVHSLPVTEQKSAFTDLERRWKCHCQWLTLRADRHIEVIFITGKGGTGKTFYAKNLMDKLGYDYCVSSSSNDPWQDYMGQKGMILDDLRDTAFGFEDLLKVLDNDTSSSIKRRFSNVVFAGFVIIITSSVPIIHWYKHPDKNGNRIPYDDLAQLYRRISCYVELVKDEIIVYNEGVDDNGHPRGLGHVFQNNLVKGFKLNKKKTDFNTLFEQICDPSTTDLFKYQQLRIDTSEIDSPLNRVMKKNSGENRVFESRSRQ